jgi:hypothetical protein
LLASKANDGLIDDRMVGRFEFGPSRWSEGRFYADESSAFLV